MVTSRSPRANWYYGWNITGLMVLSQLAASGLPINCFSLFARAWSQEYQVPVSTFATGATVLLLASALLAPAVGWCADRLPVRWLMAAGLGLVALFHVAIGLTTEGWQIVLLFCVLAPFALVLSSNVPAQTLVSRWFVRRRGFALGLSAAGLALGGVAFPPLVVWLLSNFGWRETWSVFGAVIAVLILPVMAVFVRERPGPGDRQDYAPADLTKSHSATLNYRQIAGRRNFWVTVGVVVPVFFVALGVGFNLALIVTSFGFSLNVAGLMLSGWSVAGLVSRLGLGLLIDRLGGVRLPLVAIGLVSALGLSLVAIGGASLPVLTAGLLIIGLSTGAWTVLASALAAEFGPQGFGRAFGLACGLMPLASVAPPILAQIKESTGSYTGGLIGFAVMIVIAAAVGLLFREKPAPPLARTPAQAE